MNNDPENLDSALLDQLDKLTDSIANMTADPASVERSIENAIHLKASNRNSKATRNSNVPFDVNVASSQRRRFLSWLSVAASIAGVLFLLSLARPSESNLYAKMQEAIGKAKTISLTATSFDSDGNVTLESQFYLEFDKRTWEKKSTGMIDLIDYENHTALKLDTDTKTGEMFPLYRIDESLKNNHWITELLRGSGLDNAKRTGNTVVGGRQGIQYSVDAVEPYPDLVVVVDEKTRLPIQIKSVDGRLVLEDFEFDKPMEESVLSLKPPKDYKVNVFREGPKVDDSELVLTPGHQLGDAQWGMSKEEVIDAIGRPDGTRSGIPARDGGAIKDDQLVYDSRGFRISFNRAGEMVGVSCEAISSVAIRSRVFPGQLNSGIRMLDSYEKVIKAYGEPVARMGTEIKGTIEYNLLGGKVSLRFRDGKLVSIDTE